MKTLWIQNRRSQIIKCSIRRFSRTVNGAVDISKAIVLDLRFRMPTYTMAWNGSRQVYGCREAIKMPIYETLEAGGWHSSWSF